MTPERPPRFPSSWRCGPPYARHPLPPSTLRTRNVYRAPGICALTGKLVKAIEKRQKKAAGTPASRDIEARLELLERDFYELDGMSRERYLHRREGLLRRLENSRKAEEARGSICPGDWRCAWTSAGPISPWRTVGASSPPVWKG
jgi:hypothetical protein